MSFAIISSSIVRGIQGLNQTRVRKIIAYSSINHTGWIISSILTSTDTWIAYIIVYSFILSTITYFFNIFNVSWIQQLNFIYTDKKNTKLILFINFLSLGGLPPFIGFFPKWLVIIMILKNGFFSTCFILIIRTLITLFFYVRLTFSSFRNKTIENVIFVIKHLRYPVILFNIFFLLRLILYIIYYSLF